MKTTEPQRRARDKWLREKVEEVKFRVPMGRKQVIQEHAKARGESVNAFILRAVNTVMAMDTDHNSQLD